jgi:RNA-directed DNA polymerase
MREQAKEVTRRGPSTSLEYVRFADDLVIVVEAYPQPDWLLKAVDRRLREELAKLQVSINAEKSRGGDWGQGESLSFLGFDFRRIRSRQGAWRAW